MREAVWNAIDTPGIDDERDEGVRDAEREEQRAEGSNLLDGVGGQPADGDERRSAGVRPEQRG